MLQSTVSGPATPKAGTEVEPLAATASPGDIHVLEARGLSKLYRP
ncbi:MAG TPA: hypothetical protein VM198_06345 [Longimicrobiales bacterium]|nr:hypothetical protein [Longimicrobiales bacterium]